MADFKCRTQIQAPPEVVFDLARDIDAHVPTQSSARERAVAGVTRGLIDLGESVTWRATHFGVPFKMTSAITAFDRPSSFVDEQTRGPFKRFRHEHRFEPSPRGTTMLDHIQFDAPLSLLGRMVDRAILGRYMRKLIEDARPQGGGREPEWVVDLALPAPESIASPMSSLGCGTGYSAAPRRARPAAKSRAQSFGASSA